MSRSSQKSVQTTSTNRLRQFFVTKVIVGHGKAVYKDLLEVPGKDDSVVPTLQLRKPPEGLEGAASLSTQEAPSVEKHSWHFSNTSDLCFLSFCLDINSMFPTIAPFRLLLVSEVPHGGGRELWGSGPAHKPDRSSFSIGVIYPHSHPRASSAARDSRRVLYISDRRNLG